MKYRYNIFSLLVYFQVSVMLFYVQKTIQTQYGKSPVTQWVFNVKKKPHRPNMVSLMLPSGSLMLRRNHTDTIW